MREVWDSNVAEIRDKGSRLLKARPPPPVLPPHNARITSKHVMSNTQRGLPLEDDWASLFDLNHSPSPGPGDLNSLSQFGAQRSDPANSSIQTGPRQSASKKHAPSFDHVTPAALELGLVSGPFPVDGRGAGQRNGSLSGKTTPDVDLKR